MKYRLVSEDGRVTATVRVKDTSWEAVKQAEDKASQATFERLNTSTDLRDATFKLANTESALQAALRRERALLQLVGEMADVLSKAGETYGELPAGTCACLDHLAYVPHLRCNSRSVSLVRHQQGLGGWYTGGGPAWQPWPGYVSQSQPVEVAACVPVTTTREDECGRG